MIVETQAIEQFCDAMFDKDIDVDPLDIIADGKLHRVRDKGDAKNVKDAFYVLHVDDRPAGLFGHNGKYGYDVKFPWSMKVDRPVMSAEEKRAHREQMEAKRAQCDAETAARHAQAADLANGAWDAATQVEGDDHPYLKHRGVESYGLRRGAWKRVDLQTGEVKLISDDALLVPIRDVHKKIHSLQAILPDGDRIQGRNKDYLSGGNKHGHFYAFGKLRNTKGDLVANTSKEAVILIAEGYATAASLHAATGHAVIVAFDAPNLMPVAEAMRGNFPNATIVVCSDNDQWTTHPVNNPGLTRAHEVCEAVGALVAVPQFDAALGVANEAGKLKGPTDFNDLMKLEGIDAVRQVIAAALGAGAAIHKAKDSAAAIGSTPAAAPVPAPVDVANIPPWDDVPGIEGMTSPDLPEDDMPGVMFVESLPPMVPADLSKGETIDLPIDNRYFRCLGYRGEKYYLFHNESKQVKEFTIKDISENFLLGIARVNWWELHFPNGRDAGINKRAAVNFLVAACLAGDIYDNSRQRGRGAWIDEGRTVYHHGKYLTVDTAQIGLESIRSHFAYVKDIAWPEPADTELSDEDGQKLVHLASQFRWSKPGSAALLAGFTFLAPICGALNWRPHIWLTGGAGCGKSTVLNEYVFPLMNGTSIYAQGNSTEAGLRQTLQSDARPVLFDESESNEEADIRRIQNVLSLIRQASTESAARTLKGTAGGEAISFHIRSMFALASIQVGLKNQADFDRLTVLGLRSRRQDNGAGDEWKALSKTLYETIKCDVTIGARMLRRALSMMPTIQKNIAVFKEAAAVFFSEQRAADQFGTLLAGCWSMMCGEVATFDDAMDMMKGFDWSEHRDQSEQESGSCSADTRKTISTLFGQMVRLPESNQATTLGALVRCAAGIADDDDDVALPAALREPKKAQRELYAYGIRIDGDPGKRPMYVSVANNQIPPRERLLERTSLATDLKGALRRIPGADNGENKAQSFGGAHGKSKVTRIPFAFVANDDEAVSPDEELQGAF